MLGMGGRGLMVWVRRKCKRLRILYNITYVVQCIRSYIYGFVTAFVEIKKQFVPANLTNLFTHHILFVSSSGGV